MLKAFILLVVLVVAGALALKLLIPLIEPGFAFFPTAGEPRTPEAYGLPFEAARVTTSDGESIHVWRIPGIEPVRARIVYFHGNGGNLALWTDVLVPIARRGYEVVALDYRGYGLSSGRPSEQGLYRDVEAVVHSTARERQAGDRPTIYWGRSLGATMAAYATRVARPDGVILESGFPDARTLVRGLPVLALLAPFSTYRFPTADWLSTYDGPVLVLHGDRDSVVPYEMGEQLYSRLDGPKRFFRIARGDHNDLTPPEPVAYWAAVDEFIESTAGGGSGQ